MAPFSFVGRDALQNLPGNGHLHIELGQQRFGNAHEILELSEPKLRPCDRVDCSHRDVLRLVEESPDNRNTLFHRKWVFRSRGGANYGMQMGRPFRNVTGILSGSPVHVSPADIERVWRQFDADVGDRRHPETHSESGR